MRDKMGVVCITVSEREDSKRPFVENLNYLCNGWVFIFHLLLIPDYSFSIFLVLFPQKEMLLYVHFENLSLTFMFNCSLYESYAFSSYIF